jgi:hypothetical protein
MTNGQPTTIAVARPTQLDGSSSIVSLPQTTSTATDSGDAASSVSDSPTPTRTGISSSLVPSKDFPVCHDTSAKPFCQPVDGQQVYVGQTYYVTWNADFFPENSTFTVMLNHFNDSQTQAWNSGPVAVEMGVAMIPMEEAWLQGFSQYNLTFYGLLQENGKAAVPYDGPQVLLMHKPADHYQPPPHTKLPDKFSLMLGLPLGLGIPALIILGLYLGMRKHRTIGLGNIMSRARHPWNKNGGGYGARKSRRQRLGLGKKGAIRLQDRDLGNLPPEEQYRDEVGGALPPPGRPGAHQRDLSLGSLVSDDDIRPAPRGNAFRDEVERQRTGR